MKLITQNIAYMLCSPLIEFMQ